MKVISIDPGVTTGFCYAEITPKEKMEFFPSQNVDDVDDLWRRLVRFEPRYIVMESFEFRQGKQHSGINLFPKELIGVTRLYSLLASQACGLYMQTASQGKGYYNDKKLSDHGFIKRGDKTHLGHGLDATRHLLQWVTFGAGFEFNSTKESIHKFATRLDSWPPTT